MKNLLKKFEENKEEIIELTLNEMGEHLEWDGMFAPNVAFFIKEGEGIEIDSYPFVGNQSHPDNVFMIIQGHEIPDPNEYGYETLSEMDFAACGYNDIVKQQIENHIENLWTEINF